MRDALKNYLALATGLTEVSKQQAKTVAKSLVKQGEATRGQVDRITDDLVATSRANRAVIVSIVRSEIDKALGRLGLATADEVGKLSRRLQDLEGALRSAVDDDGASRDGGTAATAATAPGGSAAPAARKAAAKATKASGSAAATPAKSAKSAAPAKSAKSATSAKPAGAAKKPAAKKAPAKGSGGAR